MCGGCGSRVFGAVPDCGVLERVTGMDYVWSFELRYPPGHASAGQPQPFPVGGTLSYRIETTPPTVWQFVIAGAVASIKVESEVADKVPDRTPFKLVWLPPGELGGGQAWAVGKVQVVK